MATAKQTQAALPERSGMGRDELAGALGED